MPARLDARLTSLLLAAGDLGHSAGPLGTAEPGLGERSTFPNPACFCVTQAWSYSATHPQRCLLEIDELGGRVPSFLQDNGTGTKSPGPVQWHRDLEVRGRVHGELGSPGWFHHLKLTP